MNAFLGFAVVYTLLSAYFYWEWRKGKKLDLEFPTANMGFAKFAWCRLRANVFLATVCWLLCGLVHFTTV